MLLRSTSSPLLSLCCCAHAKASIASHFDAATRSAGAGGPATAHLPTRRPRREADCPILLSSHRTKPLPCILASTRVSQRQLHETPCRLPLQQPRRAPLASRPSPRPHCRSSSRSSPAPSRSPSSRTRARADDEQSRQRQRLRGISNGGRRSRCASTSRRPGKERGEHRSLMPRTSCRHWFIMLHGAACGPSDLHVIR